MTTTIELTKVHKDFLQKEFGVTDVDSLNDDAFFELYDKLCDIEVNEFCDNIESERGDTAVEIMDYMAEQFIDDDNKDE